jgi:hypothetical protein
MAWHENSKRVTVRTLFRQGWSHSMIAKRTSVPLGTVKDWIRQIRLPETEQKFLAGPVHHALGNAKANRADPPLTPHDKQQIIQRFKTEPKRSLREHEHDRAPSASRSTLAPSCTIKIASLLPSKKASYHACSEETSCDICKISLGRRMFFILLRG